MPLFASRPVYPRKRILGGWVGAVSGEKLSSCVKKLNLSAGWSADARHSAKTIRRKRIFSQARTKRRLWPTAVRMALAASPAVPLRLQQPREPSAFIWSITARWRSGGGVRAPEGAWPTVACSALQRPLGQLEVISVIFHASPTAHITLVRRLRPWNFFLVELCLA